ncbi:MAG: guanylate kinase [Pseudomonadota bacterium]
MPNPTRRGLMLILSSPSGAGKTTIANALLTSETHLKTSISVTTRPKRPNEIDGRDYYFVTHDEFQQRISADDFFEYAEVFGNLYGTPKQFVLDTLSSGQDVVFDIDWQGTQQISQSARGDLVTIFILPPSLEELEARLRGRNQDSIEVVNQRMHEASAELSHWPEYNYVVINHELDESVITVRSILRAERHRRKRQVGLADFVNHMRV